MADYEKLGAFYLGRPYDLKKGVRGDGDLLYDSRDLVTHAVCVGMTGSGKTGLCIGLLEEAAIDGIPALVIDPKGDIGNLLLTFPNLAPADFRPWINEDDAVRKGMTPDEYSAAQADLWRNGLAEWDQSGERIARLREAADFAIYTPGSEAGIPISIIDSFSAPSEAVRMDSDAYQERIETTVTSLLALLGINADPIQSREHILISNILNQLWSQGKSIDLPGLIAAIQEPPVKKIGVLDLESFFPGKDRFGLAMRINNLLASPSFQSWTVGQPLDIQRLLYTEEGKPRVAVISIAHLSESERMFCVSLILNEFVSWVRSRPGTTSLRALLYMDEIFGYMPPVAEPPSKKPLLTLMKQGRAFGAGVVLATQNPVDLDYKALSNAGTWFIGRLQTERDKMRVLEGLEGAAASQVGFDKGEMDEVLAGLGKRKFLLHNVHEPGPVVFETRWAMSYLRGPLTRDQIKVLMADRRLQGTGSASSASPVASPASVPAVATAPSALQPPAPAEPEFTPRPVLSSSIPEVFLPLRRHSDRVTWAPYILGVARVHFVDSKTKKTLLTREISALTSALDGDPAPDWEAATESGIAEVDLERTPRIDGDFLDLQSDASNGRSYASWGKDLSDHLYRSSSCDIWKSPTYKISSRPEESESDFRIRLRDIAREVRDEEVGELRRKFATKVERLEERIRKAHATLDKEREQAKGQRLQSAISIGATLLSAFTGRSAVGRATTAARSLSRRGKEKGDIERAEDNVESLTLELEELNADLQEQIDELEDRYDPLAEELEGAAIRPRRADVDVRSVALAWVPCTRTPSGALEPLWK